MLLRHHRRDGRQYRCTRHVSDSCQRYHLSYMAKFQKAGVEVQAYRNSSRIPNTMSITFRHAIELALCRNTIQS